MKSPLQRALAPWALVASSAVGLLWPSVGRAADTAEAPRCPAPAAEDTEAARGLFRRGQAAFNEGAYDQALELWKRAYELDCTAHGLLLNLAMAHELLGRPEDAVRALEQFNSRAPDSPYAAANEKRVARLRKRALDDSRARARALSERRRQVAPPIVRVTPAREPFASTTLALALAAAGGASAVAGAALYAEARAAAASAAERCDGAPGHCSSGDAVIQGERARARAELAGWLAGSGLVALAGGLVWFFATNPSAAPAPGLDWTAELSSDHVDLRVGGTF